MKLTIKNGQYVDENNNVFPGVVPRDLEVGDQYQTYDFQGFIVLMEVVEKIVDENGGIQIRSKEVAV